VIIYAVILPKQKTLSSRQGLGNKQDQGSVLFPPPFCEAVVNPTRAGDLACWQGLKHLTNIQLRDSAGLRRKLSRWCTRLLPASPWIMWSYASHDPTRSHPGERILRLVYDSVV